MKRLSPFSTPFVLPAVLERAVQCLRAGGLVAYPTDTVYGLGAAAGNDEAVRRLFEAKDRPLDRALPLLLASAEQVGLLAVDVPPVAHRLMAAFWPGGLTLVLRRAPSYRSLALGAGDTVAVRVPDHPIPRQLVEGLGEPITGTSANRSGARSPRTAAEVRRQLGDMVEMVIDGGPSPGGVESTVVDCTVDPPRLLRQGAVAWEDIKRVMAEARSGPCVAPRQGLC